MKALVYGVKPEPWDPPDPSNRLQVGLATSPIRLVYDREEPHPTHRQWVMAKTRMTGICGSDAKQVFMDFGTMADTPLNNFFSMPTVLGHEVVAEVAELGPGVRGLEVGQRVVLNPWLSCGPRGLDPPCPACRAGDYSLCWHFKDGQLAPGIHTGTSSDAPGGWADYLPAHDSMLFPVPDSVPDEVAVLADPFAVSLHSVTRHPPPENGRAFVYGAGALGTMATAILRALYPSVEVMVVARFASQAELARRLGATVVAHEPLEELIEEAVRWSGGVVMKSPGGGLPMAYPGGIDVVYDTIGTAKTAEVGVRVLRARGTMVKSGVHAPDSWEWSPLYFKEISWVGSNAFGVEEVDGMRLHGIQHFLRLVGDGRVDLTGLLTHTFTLDNWRDAFVALSTQADSGAMKVAFDFR